MTQVREGEPLSGKTRVFVQQALDLQERDPKRKKTVHREYMKYDEYLAAGYPIGSGVAEGACRHVVKDRLELTGMRWTVEGAQSVLHLRAIYLNDDWEEFQNHYIETEQARLYGKSAA